MTWAYSGDPATSDKDAVRFLTGDTDSGDQLASDEEIAYALSQRPDVRLAAALVCDAIAARFSRLADARVGDVSESASQRAAAYRDRAEALRTDAAVAALPSFGGLTKSGKRDLDGDSDAVQPSFRIGRDDHPESASDRGAFEPWRGA